MVTIDLTAPQAPAATFLEGLPRRVALTLAELSVAARLAGDAPLPFEVTQPVKAGVLEDRLGLSRGSLEDAAYAEALASLHDGEETLRRRGLVTEDGLDAGPAGALGLLATPALALDIDVATAGRHVKSWHRQAGEAVATLSTCDGIVFELAWFRADRWPAELARVTTLPEDLELGASEVPAELDVPFQLVDAVGEALRSGRADLVPVLLAQHGEGVLCGGRPLAGDAAATAVAAIHTEGRGRLRVLAARVAEGSASTVGVVSWVLLADGWHALRPHQDDHGGRVRARRAEAGELASELAPVLAQVSA